MGDDNSIRTVIRNINKTIGIVVNAFEVWSLILCMFLLTSLLIINVIAREFFVSIYFAEEVAEFLLIFVTFVGVSYGVRKARHIRMGAFFDMMSPKIEKFFMLFIATVSAVVMFIMAFTAYEYVMTAMSRGHETGALRLPYWIFYAIIPVGFFMAGIQYIRTIIKNLTEKDTWMSPEQQSEYEDEII
ncbi:MAG: TRAP transporter small permease [Desulfobacula sp.]|jgi:C4-dicarboxylate transporter, DctQ subunit|uniref:TRAP transporter small permease n=1 Tax=Desulfobacula sp. TaxID=2593537 RepID=UPI001D9E681A|nr:TRAP transporter small permease [Desulfobacula sp.]MBT3483692.1 TRAP transporter small permease [Desulfobacula sp.]MBT3803534.1 TRAP transporter small permease [Desulfobacula sp.]MBT4023328.1 TRAP transporter small permease [Desulfobacula sp.]MBT4197313.1 TRAP transporter small permease [Desulfobacula sp.]